MTDTPMLPDEVQIKTTQADRGTIMLTNFRVRCWLKGSSSSIYHSMPLEKISVCSLSTKSYPILLLLAVLFGLGAVLAPTVAAKVIAGSICVVLVPAYFALKPGQLKITSDSGASIAVPTRGFNSEEAVKFADAVCAEFAKLR